MKVLVLLLTFISAVSFAKGGNGAGNGGLGYRCKMTSYLNSNFEATIALDLFENLSTHFSADYFKYYFNPADNYANEISTPLIREIYKEPEFASHTEEFFLTHNRKKNAEILNVMHSLGRNIKEIIKKHINLEESFLNEIFTKQELVSLKRTKEQFFTNVFYVPYLLRGPKNATQDTGKIKELNNDLLKKYGLKDCKLIQIVKLRKKKHINAFDFVVYLETFNKMDDKNFLALLWHEIIYLALPDQDSSRTRNLVSKIIKHKYIKQ